jgi:hypothetical protein
MKTISLIITIIFAASLFSATQVLNSNTQLFRINEINDNADNIHFSLDSYDITEISKNDENFKRISYPGESEFIIPGKPDLPRFSRLIAIPDFGEVSLEIVSIDEEILSDTRIYPRQPLKKDNSDNVFEFTIDTDFYSSDQRFPENIVEIGTPAVMRDLRVVTVTVNPFQYDPQNNSVRIIKNVEFNIIYKGRNGINQKETIRSKSRSFNSFYDSVVLNNDTLASERDGDFQHPCILYICDDNNSVETYLQYLVDWKHEKGFDVVVANTSETGSSRTQIKNYIQDAYDSWENPPEYVCFVGDTGDIPTWTESWSGYGGEGDHPYGQLEGNDILVDVHLGRISYNTITVLQTIINKTIKYEKNPCEGDDGWYERAVLVGDPSSSGQTTITTNKFVKEVIEDHNPNFSFIEIYSGSFNSQMNSALTNGSSYFNYRGYWGVSSFNWSANNGCMTPFAVVITCDTGTFEGSTSDSETYLRLGTPSTPRGAIGAIGTATTGTHTCFNNSVATGIANGMFADDIFSMGGSLTRGKLNLFIQYPDNPSNKVNIFSHWNTLMGDASTEIWTAEPKEMNILYNDNLALGSNYITITATDGAGSPLENVWITALQGDDIIFQSDFTDENGEVFLPLENQDLGDVTLTATKHNYMPHSGEFQIVQEAVFVNSINSSVDDDNTGESSGNNDGLINPGESIELAVQLSNFGSSTANSVSAEISTESDVITITDNTETYGDLVAGSTAYPADDFDFDVAESALGGTEIVLDLDISDSAGNEWEDKIHITIDGANLYANDFSVPDGTLNPGETTDLTVTIKNMGTVSAYDIEGTLRSNNSGIVINDSIGVFGIVTSGSETDNGGNPFNVSVSSEILPGTQLPLSLYLFNSEGYNDVVDLVLEIGVVSVTDPLGPDTYGYYCYDDEDEMYNLSPIYSWVEIDTNYGGNGTNLNMNDNGNDGDLDTVNIPFDFQFYGVQYSDITICSNGFIAPGGSEQYCYMNWHIPGPAGPNPMIAPFWDDLQMGSGDVFYYYNNTNNYFVVEWSHLKNEYNNSSEETFQVIIYDPEYYPTLTGDADILFQYKTVNNVDQGSYGGWVSHGQYATVGIEGLSSTVGLEYTYDNDYPTAAKHLENNMAILFTTNAPQFLAPPIADVSHDYLTFALLEETTDSQTLQISNTGESNLVYNVSKTYIETEELRDSGGPDNYGYMWTDSNENGGPDYSWRDISASGIEVSFSQNDEGTSLMPIGFTFNFYGEDYTNFRINPNGWIGFGSDETEWINTSLPNSNAPRPAIMGFWDDLDPLQGGEVSYYSTSDSLVVWFDDVLHYPGDSNGTYNFEIIIYETGEMLMQYQSMSGEIGSATIGLQNANANDALQVCYDSDYVENNLAIRIDRVINWLDISDVAGLIPGGETRNITITADSDEMPLGEYLCNLNISTNDPLHSLFTIPVELIVTDELPAIAVSVNTLNFEEVDFNTSDTMTFTVSNTGTALLSISDIVVQDPIYTADVSQFDLNPGEEQIVEITFSPTEEAEYESELTIFSDDNIYPEYIVTLSGAGVEPTSSGNDINLVTKLSGNYPNPFNPETTILFSVKEKNINTNITVYNLKGQKVKTLINENLTPGSHRVVWNGTDKNGKAVSGGVYFYKMQSGKYVNYKKTVLIK